MCVGGGEGSVWGEGAAHNISNISMGRDVPTKWVLFLVCLKRGCVSL